MSFRVSFRVAGCVWLALAGCSGDAKSGGNGEEGGKGAAAAERLGQESAAGASAGAGTQNAGKAIEPGLEVLAWTTKVDDRGVAAALKEFATFGEGVSEGLSRVWRANGLRVVVVPLDQAEKVRGLLASALNTDRQWLGQAYSWTPVVYGPTLGSETQIKTDADVIRVQEGRMRMLARCWVTPRAPEPGGTVSGAALRLELAIQHQDARDESGGASDVMSEGLVFRRFAGSIDARGRVAYVILSEDAQTDWKTSEKIPDESEAALGPREAKSGSGGASSEMGPPSPWGPLTVGEALLRGGMSGVVKPGQARAQRTRTVVMLVPRVPERFELMPMTAGAGGGGAGGGR